MLRVTGRPASATPINSGDGRTLSDETTKPSTATGTRAARTL